MMSFRALQRPWYLIDISPSKSASPMSVSPMSISSFGGGWRVDPTITAGITQRKCDTVTETGRYQTNCTDSRSQGVIVVGPLSVFRHPRCQFHRRAWGWVLRKSHYHKLHSRSQVLVLFFAAISLPSHLPTSLRRTYLKYAFHLPTNSNPNLLRQHCRRVTETQALPFIPRFQDYHRIADRNPYQT